MGSYPNSFSAFSFFWLFDSQIITSSVLILNCLLHHMLQERKQEVLFKRRRQNITSYHVLTSYSFWY